jgi:hypothetical protein
MCSFIIYTLLQTLRYLNKTRMKWARNMKVHKTVKKMKVRYCFVDLDIDGLITLKGTLKKQGDQSI